MPGTLRWRDQDSNPRSPGREKAIPFWRKGSGEAYRDQQSWPEPVSTESGTEGSNPVSSSLFRTARGHDAAHCPTNQPEDLPHNPPTQAAASLRKSAAPGPAATGVITYLANGGALEHAQQITSMTMSATVFRWAASAPPRRWRL